MSLRRALRNARKAVNYQIGFTTGTYCEACGKNTKAAWQHLGFRYCHDCFAMDPKPPIRFQGKRSDMDRLPVATKG